MHTVVQVPCWAPWQFALPKKKNDQCFTLFSLRRKIVKPFLVFAFHMFRDLSRLQYPARLFDKFLLTLIIKSVCEVNVERKSLVESPFGMVILRSCRNVAYPSNLHLSVSAFSIFF